MNQELTSPPTQPIQPIQPQPSPAPTERPTLVTIIAVLMIIGAIILPIIGIGAAIALTTLSKAPAIAAIIIAAVLVIPSAVLSLITGVGLLKMKKWSLYLIMILVALGIIQAVYSYFSGHGINISDDIWGLAIEVVIAIYLWSIRKQFN